METAESDDPADAVWEHRRVVEDIGERVGLRSSTSTVAWTVPRWATGVWTTTTGMQCISPGKGRMPRLCRADCGPWSAARRCGQTPFALRPGLARCRGHGSACGRQCCL